MRLRILRGAKEIGGTCIELEARGSRLVLDLGLPIEAKGQPKRLMPRVPGLAGDALDRPLAILLSHPHQDHVGLASLAHPSIPVYIGREADTLLRAAFILGAPGANFSNVKHYEHKKTIEIGPFSVTPFLVDHSAYDAYAFLIQDAQTRLFYSGDFRGHGRKSRMFRQLVASGPTDIDAVLLEGTNITRVDVPTSRSEETLEDQFSDSIRATAGLVFACFSAQNIDRFVTVYRAARRAQRTLVIDLYFAYLLRALARKSLPDPTNSDLRILLPNSLKRRIVRKTLFDLVSPFRHRRIYMDEIARRRSKLVITFRSSFVKDFTSYDWSGSRLIYSQWSGYLRRDRVDLREWCRSKCIEFELLHTSGHADINSLIELVTALRPRAVIPIHTRAPQAYHTLFSHVREIPDDTWHELSDLREGVPTNCAQTFTVFSNKSSRS